MTSPPGRVLHFTARWLPPSEVFVYDLVRHLRRPGLVVSAERPEHTGRFPHPELRSLAPVEALARPAVRAPAVTAALRGLARWRGVGVVHAHHGYRAWQLAGLVRRRRLPFVLSLHGHDVTGYLAHHPHAYDEVRELVDAVLVPSRFLGGLAEAAGFPAERLMVLPSGVDTGRFRPTPLPPEPEVLFVGRFVAKKGLDVLAEAWPAVRAAVPGARLRVLGFGPLEPLARGIDGPVTVELAPRPEAVSRAMARAQVVVSPSRTADDDAVESLLMVNVEAQASGRPVVTTRHGGIPEHVVEGETALLVPEADPAALAEALVRVLADDRLAQSMAAAGPAFAARYDLRATAARLDHLYDHLIEPGPWPPPTDPVPTAVVAGGRPA